LTGYSNSIVIKQTFESTVGSGINDNLNNFGTI
jgi:hypothetical protein